MWASNWVFGTTASVLLQSMQKKNHIPEVLELPHEFLPLVQPLSEDPGLSFVSRIARFEERLICAGDFVEVLQQLETAARLLRSRCLEGPPMGNKRVLSVAIFAVNCLSNSTSIIGICSSVAFLMVL